MTDSSDTTDQAKVSSDTATDARIAALEAQVLALRQEMQDFSYTVSHDLRAPLRHIISFAHLVQEDAGPLLNEEVQGFLTTITDSARHMGVLLDGLMELSRAGTAPLHIEPVDVHALLQDVVEEVKFKYALRTIDWQIHDRMPEVLADANLLRQALLQVLDNSAKFTSGQGVAKVSVTCVTSSSVDGASEVSLEIRDNGVGFNPALANQLFHPFKRLHTSQQFAGIGMGLALARKQLARMGGAITAQGEVGEGCSVSLSLPNN
jgi:signal transduction histidine kinase